MKGVDIMMNLFLRIRNTCWWSPQQSYTPISELDKRQLKMVLATFGVESSDELHAGMKYSDSNFICTIEEGEPA